MASTFDREIARRQRWDSWINALTGLGGTRDKSTQVYVSQPLSLRPEVLEALYAGDDLARRIVDGPVPDALRQGIPVKGDDDGAIADEAERLEAWEAFTRATIWGRLHGGGFLLLGLKTGRQDEPLEFNRIQEGDLQWVMDLDRWAVTPQTWYSDLASPKYGQPELYLLSPPSTSGTTGVQGSVVHESRLIRFPGIKTTRRRRAENDGFDDPALVPVFPVLRDANTVWRSSVYAAQDLSQGVMKIKGLTEMIAEGQREVVLNRMELVDMARSVARSLVLDADGESFEQVDGKGLGTMPAVMSSTWQRLAAAAGMPVTVLMGISPAGMNATGESDIRLWYDRVSDYRRDVIEPRAMYLLDILARSTGVNPDDLSIEWPSLWQMTAMEEATYRKTIAETDHIYIADGAVLPEEVALSRWGGDEYSAEMTIDPTIREALAAAELSRMAKGDPAATDPATPAPTDPAPTDPAAPAATDPAAPTAPIKPGDQAPDPASTLNGAQIKGLQDTILLVVEGQIPKETAVQILIASFPLTEEDARRILADIVEPEQKPNPVPPPSPFGPGQPQPPPNAPPDGQPA